MKSCARLVAPIAIGVASMLVPAADARAQACIQWSADGTFKLRQANGFRVTMVINQRGEDISGIAISGGNNGSVDGFIQGSRLNFTVTWSSGSVGVYTGFVDENGDVQDGRTYDRRHPESWSTWTNTTPLTCARRRHGPHH